MRRIAPAECGLVTARRGVHRPRTAAFHVSDARTPLYAARIMTAKGSLGRRRVGILHGGRSVEHEISVLSAKSVVDALDRARFEPILIGIDHDGVWRRQTEEGLRKAATNASDARIESSLPVVAFSSLAELGLDVVFPVLHGPGGEDGTMQGLLEQLDLPYVGSGVLGSAAAMDKDVTKRLLRDAGIAVARFVTLRSTEFARDPGSAVERALALGFPCFVKPANLGSSVGVRRATSVEELHDALTFAFGFDAKVLVEEAVTGREIECAVLGNDDPRASGVGEIVVEHPEGFYSYDAKYLSADGARLILPAVLGDAEREGIRAASLRAFQAVECQGLARVDFFLRPDGSFLVNEINTLPGFTSISMYPKLWEHEGIGPTELVTQLLELAMERHRRRARLQTRQSAPTAEV